MKRRERPEAVGLCGIQGSGKTRVPSPAEGFESVFRVRSEPGERFAITPLEERYSAVAPE